MTQHVEDPTTTTVRPAADDTNDAATAMPDSGNPAEAATSATPPVPRPDVPDDLRISLAKYLKRLAEQICSEQPNVPKPQELVDLDSFSAIQVVLEAENHLGTPVLEDLGDFAGNTYDELSRYLLEAIAIKGELETVAERL